jgi:hypothetical protein
MLQSSFPGRDGSLPLEISGDKPTLLWVPTPGFEAALYESLFAKADVDQDGIISGNEGVAFLMRTGRPRDELRKIWELASHGGANLSKGQFFEAIRLVHIAQNGMPLTRGAAARSIGATLSGALRISWSPVQSEVTYFDELFQRADSDGDGVVGGREGVNFLLKSGLPRNQLRHVWDLASEGGASLSREQFYNAMRLLALVQAGHKIDAPEVLTDTSLLLLKLPVFLAGTALEQRNIYEDLWQSAPKAQSESMSGQEAVAYFRQSKLPDETLRTVWNLAAAESQRLDAARFTTAMRLIAAAQQGHDIRTINVASLDNMCLCAPNV